MGVLFSNLSKLDSIINPDVSTSTQTTDTTPNSGDNTRVIDSTVKESESSALKGEEPAIEEAETVQDTIKEKDESVESDKKEEGKKVEVEPVDVSKTADVIKKTNRKRKRNQIA